MDSGPRGRLESCRPHTGGSSTQEKNSALPPSFHSVAPLGPLALGRDRPRPGPLLNDSFSFRGNSFVLRTFLPPAEPDVLGEVDVRDVGPDLSGVGYETSRTTKGDRGRRRVNSPVEGG